MPQSKTNPLVAGAIQGCIPLIGAAAGMAKLGYFHLGIAVLAIVLAAFMFQVAYSRTKYSPKAAKNPFIETAARRPLR